MKILIAATGAPGHLNPLLAAGSVLCRHHEVGVQVAKELRPQVEGAQLRYFPEQEGKRALVQIASSAETLLINMDTLSIEKDSIPDGERCGVLEPESAELELPFANASD
jgi:UDP:flavonoid glycosyltransferase YjiC (YdhE family)